MLIREGVLKLKLGVTESKTSEQQGEELSPGLQVYKSSALTTHHSVSDVVQFYPWFKFCFLLFLGIVMYDYEFETKEN